MIICGENVMTFLWLAKLNTSDVIMADVFFWHMVKSQTLMYFHSFRRKPQAENPQQSK